MRPVRADLQSACPEKNRNSNFIKVNIAQQEKPKNNFTTRYLSYEVTCYLNSTRNTNARNRRVIILYN